MLPGMAIEVLLKTGPNIWAKVQQSDTNHVVHTEGGCPRQHEGQRRGGASGEQS